MRLPLPERAGSAPPPDLAAIRQGMAAAASGGQWRTSPEPREVAIGGVRVLHHPPAGPSRGAVVHFHGGGYRMGMPEAVGPYARRLADICAVDVFCPAYRLAPDHPFPAGLNDGWAVVRALADDCSGRLVLAGDSAGGGLAAALAAELAATGLGPAGLVLHSPWLDLTVTSQSYGENAGSDPLFSEAKARDAAGHYLQQSIAPDDPLASPLFADPTLFPPTLITVGTGEVLRDDATGLHDRLRAAGRPVRLLQIAGMDHVAVTRGPDLPGAAESLRATREWLARVLPR